MNKDILFELGTEELPSGSVEPLAKALAQQLTDRLQKAQIEFKNAQFYATPRRLAVIVHEVGEKQPEQTISKRGPAVNGSINDSGEPSKALLGFARSNAVEVSELTQVETEKGLYWAYELNHSGQRTTELLPQMIQEAVRDLPMTKPMRWGSGSHEFARPVHWAVLLYGQDIVETEILGVKTNRYTYGHRFHHPQSIELSSPEAYEEQLQQAYVVASFTKRRHEIKSQINAIAQKQGCHAIMPEALVDEVTSIVEWPEALLASFDSSFLDVPPEALIASMQTHQKCFALKDEQGNLKSSFITISNIKSLEPQQVVLGNEKVMQARLSDAAFFYHQDKKQRLSHYLAGTEKVIFQKRLGSLFDKSQRVQKIVMHLIQPLGLDETQALRAAELSRCDLMTGMVGEFPELQGLMGYYYALNDGEDKAVAQALNEQYMPRFAGDALPNSPLGLALSLADRLDTLVGIFAIGQKPSGMKDPFKLRRHALAVARMLIATPATLHLSSLIHETWRIYGDILSDDESVIADLHPFILERLYSHYQNQGVRGDLIKAVLARQDDWFYDIDARIKALQSFLDLPEATSLTAACKRVGNILQKASLKEGTQETAEALLQEDAEVNLFRQILQTEEDVQNLFLTGDYASMLRCLARLRTPIDSFFEHVMVMVEDEAIKQNRFTLLHRLQALLQGVADISVLQFSHE